MKHCAGHIRYLIAIKELSDTSETVRCVSISRHLGVSRPSVSKMLRCLANSGLVCEDFCNSVRLTEDGTREVARLFAVFSEVYTFFNKFLRLPHEEAHEQAVTFVTEFPMETCTRLKRLVSKSVGKNSASKDG